MAGIAYVLPMLLHPMILKYLQCTSRLTCLSSLMHAPYNGSTCASCSRCLLQLWQECLEVTPQAAPHHECSLLANAMRLGMDVQAALKAAVEGLAMSGGLEERQATPGMLLVPLLRHQRMALAWMCRRETGASAPWGGILADDQVWSDG